MSHETVPLLQKPSYPTTGLSLFFASLCIVDVFGVFPIIALPRPILLCGWLGVLLVLGVFALQIYTASLLAKSWCIATAIDPQIFCRNRYPLVAVTELILGRWTSYLISLLLDLSVFGGGIPNLLVASQNLQLFGLKVSQQEFNFSYCYWILIVGIILCPIAWLGDPKDMKWLVSFSTFAVFATAILLWWSILTDDRDITSTPVSSTAPWENFVVGYGILLYQFAVHPTLMTIQVDMKKPKDICKAVTHSFIVSGSLFAITAGLLELRYEGNASANALQTVPPSNATQLAIILAALQLCLSSAVGHSALFEHLECQLRLKRSFGWKRCALRSAVVFLGVAVGESMPRFDIVMALIGGTLIGPLVLVLPPLLYFKARRLRCMGLRRASAPDFLCRGPDRQATDDRSVFANPRVHSKSTHYGFKDGEQDQNDGYSFIYYEDDDDLELNLYTDYEVSFDDDSCSTRRLGETISRSGSLPAMVDASRPSLRRTRGRDAPPNRSMCKRRGFFSIRKLMDLFGYCIVILGIAMTVPSTYISVQNTMQYIRLTPPCMFNATIDITNWN